VSGVRFGKERSAQMTLSHYITSKVEKDRPPIEITPEMERAGADALALCERWDSPISIIRSIYLAMECRRRDEDCP
jgi:hypothetical protein